MVRSDVVLEDVSFLLAETDQLVASSNRAGRLTRKGRRKKKG